jgi:hypothetical protein
MSSFSQWRKSLVKNPDPRQITWLCGNERVLIDDVVHDIRSKLAPEPWNYRSLVVGEDSERTIWNEADQHPMGQSPRLLVIRNAEALKDWDRFIDWIKNRSHNPKTFLILVSNEERIPRTELTPEQRRHGEKAEVLPHIAAIGTKGHVIECRPYTNATAKYAVQWVQSKVRMREGVAAHLLNRADGDLRLVRDVCTKLSVFPGEITISTISGMLIERPRDSFSDALLAMDKKTALLALKDLQPSEYSLTLGYLDSRLDLAGTIHDMQVEHRPQTEIVRAVGSQGFLVKDIILIAKHYDAKRRLTIRKMLALADEALRYGSSDGVMEAIVAFW